MGTAEQASNEIIHYLPMQLDFLGMTVRMQTLYMSWLACILTIVIVWCITSGSKMIPGRAQVALEMFFDALGGLIESNLGKEGRENCRHSSSRCSSICSFPTNWVCSCRASAYTSLRPRTT